MLPSWISTLASIGMAVGPPLVYADQSISMVRKKPVFFGVLSNIFADIINLGTQQVSLVMSVLFCLFFSLSCFNYSDFL